MTTTKNAFKKTPRKLTRGPKPQPSRWSRRAPTGKPSLRFTPYAWAKLHHFCHASNTEIGGFGLSHPEDPLLVIDFLTVTQQVTCVSVEFDDEAVAELFEAQVEAGHRPEQFARIWCHTHPGDSPDPSATDEETFNRVFRGCDWAVMFILARGGQTYARLRFSAGPGGDIMVPVAVDFSIPFLGTDHTSWRAEYEANIHPEVVATKAETPPIGADIDDWEHFDPWDMNAADDLFGDLDAGSPYDPHDLEQDREQIELLMDEYGVRDLGELRAILRHENQSILNQAY